MKADVICVNGISGGFQGDERQRREVLIRNCQNSWIGGRVVRRVVYVVLGLLGVVVLGLAVAVIALTQMDLRPRIERFASARLGRDLTIEALSVGWGNPLRLEADGLRLANPAWGSTPAMATIGHLQAEIALWPLLHGGVSLSHVVLTRPVTVLERNTDGT